MLERIKIKINNLNLTQKIILSIIAIIVIILLFLLLYKVFYSQESDVIISTEENETENNAQVKIGIKEEKNMITVHVVGEVNNPGVFKLEEGSRIIDAINSAGGKTEEADLSKINLAYILEDGVQIYVPNIKDVSKLEETGELEFIKEDAGEGVITYSAIQEKEEKNSKVNINNANLEKLQTLPGIGESTAQKIIDYRNANGKFKSVDDIKNVSGIGESKFNIIKELISV